MEERAIEQLSKLPCTKIEEGTRRPRVYEPNQARIIAVFSAMTLWRDSELRIVNLRPRPEPSLTTGISRTRLGIVNYWARNVQIQRFDSSPISA